MHPEHQDLCQTHSHRRPFWLPDLISPFMAAHSIMDEPLFFFRRFTFRAEFSPTPREQIKTKKEAPMITCMNRPKATSRREVA
jgi:hypothetical protein